MKTVALLFLVLVSALAAQAQNSLPADPLIQVDFSNPGLLPPQWTLTLHPDGTGHFRSEMGKLPSGGLKQIEVPNLDEDVQLSPDFAGNLFAIAKRNKWFNLPCESHIKVAFQGWKTMTYSGPSGHGSCTFNYSKDREIQGMGDSLQAVAQSILEGARLQILLQHDPLGLDQEMNFLVEAVGDGRAQQVCAIRSILERLVQDDSVLERVRKEARALLTCGAS